MHAPSWVPDKNGNGTYVQPCLWFELALKNRADLMCAYLQRSLIWRGIDHASFSTRFAPGFSAQLRASGTQACSALPEEKVVMTTTRAGSRHEDGCVAGSNERRGKSDMAVQFAAGGLSGLMTTIVFNPLDVIKTRMQVRERYATASKQSGTSSTSTTAGTAIPHNNSNRSVGFRHRILNVGAQNGGTIQTGLWSMLREMYRTEGIAGYYKGLNASLCALVPTWAIYWLSYEQFKLLFSRTPTANDDADGVRGLRTHANNMAAATAAGTVTTLATSPFWVVKTRMQNELAVGPLREYTSLWSSLRRIYAQEGIAALYRGLAPSLLGLLHVGIQFPVYEELKRRTESFEASSNPVSRSNGGSHQLSVMVSSSVSKVVATLFAYPHEVLRSRLQVSQQPLDGFVSDVKRMMSTARHIMRQNGIAGFYSGMCVNLLRTVPSTMLTFSTYEFVKSRSSVFRNTASVSVSPASAQPGTNSRDYPQ